MNRLRCCRNLSSDSDGRSLYIAGPGHVPESGQSAGSCHSTVPNGVRRDSGRALLDSVEGGGPGRSRVTGRRFKMSWYRWTQRLVTQLELCRQTTVTELIRRGLCFISNRQRRIEGIYRVSEMAGIEPTPRWKRRACPASPTRPEANRMVTELFLNDS